VGSDQGMILLNSTSTPKYRYEIEKHPNLFGLFITPRKRGIQWGIKAGKVWACDNDCYNLGESFDFAAFLAWLETLRPYQQKCLFVPVPDVVGNHAATLARFYEMREPIKALGFPVAFVLQDGCQVAQDVPWELCDAVFVGGTTEYKLSQTVINLLVEAGEHGKWRHVGRVNSKVRINHFYDFADSFDGTGFGREPDVKLRWCKNHLLWHKQQPRMKGL
jgi:hypothetical protein